MVNLGSGAADIAVSHPFDGVEPGTTLHYRVVAFDTDVFNIGFITKGEDVAVKTPALTTKIEKSPEKRTTQKRARFAFSSNQPGARYVCELDNDGRPDFCKSPVSFKVDPGKHVLRVKAAAPHGNYDKTPASYRWKVIEGDGGKGGH